MTELKFRAWIEKNSIMTKPFSFTDFDQGYLISEGIDIRFLQIMQYIGLKDKDGKEICEGDILREDDVDWDDEPFIGKVVFSAPQFAITWLKKKNRYTYPLDSIGFGELNDYTIIGNIYENPQLMENE